MGFALTVNAHRNLKGVSAAIKRLQEANELIAKKHGNETIRQQNLKDIQIFNAYLEKMDAAKGHQKES